MKFFVDTADIKQIEELLPTGFVDGVTTNPSLIAKQGADMSETIKKICSIVDGPVSAEVTATDKDNMLKEGKYLASIAKNVAVKVASVLRDSDRLVDLVLEDKKMKWAFKHADRVGANRIILVAPEEWKRQKIKVKDLQSGEEFETTLEEI